MGRHTGNKNQNVSTEETVVKEDPKTVIAEETAEQTTEPETVPAVEESDKATEVTSDTTDVSNGAEVSEGNNDEVTTEVTTEVTSDTTDVSNDAEVSESNEGNEGNEDQKIVSVICDKLYIRPEPNKKADIGVLIKGTELIVNNVDGKLPEGWLYVTVKDTPSVVGYVVAEYVK
ncbi:MAG: hypothetical protein IKZ85_07680 [Pseudobutyrivibrio sp.]|nr:hypothetical protein [Pseudobutyrivibrio sp.]